MTNCPRCNSFQKFTAHDEEVEPGMWAFMGVCKMCGYRMRLSSARPWRSHKRRKKVINHYYTLKNKT